MIFKPALLFAGVLSFSILAVAEDIPLSDLSRLRLKNVEARIDATKGKLALRLTEKAPDSGEAMAIIGNHSFQNGVIELDVSGAPAQNAAEFSRGFIGVAFRVQGDGSHCENFYIRPTNGRADDQLRRNHSTQYVSFPDWGWERLRKESPGVYESYADMVPGEWTHLRIVVRGTDASLFVGDTAQPALIVHGLKMGDVEGSVALWIGPGTVGLFRDLRIERNDSSR